MCSTPSSLGLDFINERIFILNIDGEILHLNKNFAVAPELTYLPVQPQMLIFIRSQGED